VADGTEAVAVLREYYAAWSVLRDLPLDGGAAMRT
jgi:hypothetical protein